MEVFSENQTQTAVAFELCLITVDMRYSKYSKKKKQTFEQNCFCIQWNRVIKSRQEFTAFSFSSNFNLIPLTDMIKLIYILYNSIFFIGLKRKEENLS